MKRIYKLLAVMSATFMSYSVFAQPMVYEGLRTTENDLSGTARYIGMGGALSALGGDISSISTNPASIALFRRNELMFSMGVNKNMNNGLSKKGLMIDNMGFVYSIPMSDKYSADKFFNFAINYKRTKNFNRETTYRGTMQNSLSILMSDLLQRKYSDDGKEKLLAVDENLLKSDGAYENTSLPWLGILGYRAFLLKPQYEGGAVKEYLHLFNGATDLTDMSYNASERGGIYSYDINGSMNINNRFYIGATVTSHKLDYVKESVYQEEIYTPGIGIPSKKKGGYDLINYYSMQGGGIDLKLGFIVRPIEDSSFRIGGAIHTPTLYNITEVNHVKLDYGIEGYQPALLKPHNRHREYYEGESEYRVLTPWKFNVSMGGTIANRAAVGVEYEYSDNSSIDIDDTRGNSMSATGDIRKMFEGVHNLKIGTEFKLSNTLALRLGYNHITSGINHNEAFKRLQNNSLRTDPEYENFGATNRYTAGFGYRTKSMYFDVAYQYAHNTGEFFPFESKDLTKGKGFKSDNSNSRLTFTLGFRY